MKLKILTLFVLTSLTSFGQSFNVQLQPFDELKVSRGVEATLYKSDSKKMEFELKGLNEDDIIIEQNTHRLTIKVRTKSLWEAMRENDWLVKVKIPYSILESIDVSTGAVVQAEEILVSENLLIDASMGGLLKLEVKSKRLIIDASMGAVSQLSGETEKLIIDSTMGAVVKAYNLSAKNARVDVSTGGVAKVFCTEEFDGEASMGGEIRVKGNPKKSFKNENMGGDIDVY